MQKLSILVPTYNRPARLSRLLYYLNSLAFKGGVPDFVEVIIADGSNAELQAQFHDDTMNYFMKPLYDLRILSVPNVSFVDRMKLLAEAAKGDYLLYVGDDDLPIFDGMEASMDKLDKQRSLSAVAGRFINITGFGISKLCFSVAERPYSGFGLTNPNTLTRLGTLIALNSVGISSLTYAMQRRETVIGHYDMVSREQISHGGLEFVHQIHTIMMGGIYFENTPFIYRDYTFIGYRQHSEREAPESDDFPYIGRNAVTFAASMIADRSRLSNEEAFQLVAELFKNAQQIQESRQAASVKLETLPIPFVKSETLNAATASWYASLGKCYPGAYVNLRRLFGSLPHSLRMKIYSMRSKLIVTRC